MDTIQNDLDIRYTASMLFEEELDHVSGGLKWDHNYVSKDVIDARGGRIQILGCLSVTLDVNGNASSVTHA